MAMRWSWACTAAAAAAGAAAVTEVGAALWLFRLLVGAAVAVAFAAYGSWTYDHWERRGVPCVRPTLPFLGNMWHALAGLRTIPESWTMIYEEGAGLGVFGVFAFRSPALLVRDPDLIRRVAVKDFDHFPNHQPPFADDGDSFLSKNLFGLRDDQWRAMRSTLSPAFTTSKLKGLVGLINECAQQLANHVKEQIVKEGGAGAELDAKELFTRFANDVIATSAFGLRCDSLRDPNNAFYANGRHLMKFRAKQLLNIIGFLICPRLMRALGARLVDRQSSSILSGIVLETMRERRRRGVMRPDMLQLLMQAQDGQLKENEEDGAEASKPKEKRALEESDVTAQALIFFFAGFETVSTALSFCAYALAAHPDARRRAQDEVDAVLADLAPDAKPDYGNVMQMKYLDMFISEVLRLYPPSLVTDRECAHPCELEGALEGGRAVHLRKGDHLWLPIRGLHLDSRYWPDPHAFKPERFSEENKKNIAPFTYMPFGVGPRLCIGQRFALLEIKLALIHLLANFDLTRLQPLESPFKYKKGFQLEPEDGHRTHFSLRVK